MSAVLDLVEPIAAGVVADEAVATDSNARFPSRGIAAFREAGLLGLISHPDVGGQGGTIGEAARVVERVARECGSTAMVLCMHYSGTAVLEAHGDGETRKDVAAGRHLSTLAFSEAGSRSHFWAPMSTARADGDHVVLDAKKSWVTSASEATSIVWSSRPLSADGASTIWLVPGKSPGITVRGPFDGLGLRGNDSAPIDGAGVRIPASARLGADGGGFDIMMGVVLPRFQLMNAGCSIGLAEGIVRRTVAHVSDSRYSHLDLGLRDLPTIRAYVARMRIHTDLARALWTDAIHAVETGRADAMLRVLQVKAAAAETALEVAALGMRVCGGQAFRKDVGIERLFRDAQAASVMAPTTDVLYDFIGKAVTGMDLF